ncbi:ACS family hexuronate transporter-like MFS transporter [Elusimicrobium posterum]|uniref:MFS transporter n=1 Tax=Elusimicrobium posterum TaxID=3116653 RepID=UPI003C77F4E3
MSQNSNTAAAESKQGAVNGTIGKYRWIICGLLFFATTVNYLDRQVLSLLQPYLSEEFGWTNSDYANIAAVFQFSYAIAMLFAGRFIDWLGTKKGYAWALILWSLGAVIHAFAVGIGTVISPIFSLVGIAIPVSVLGFMFSRLVLGIGEAGNFPAAIKTTAEWFPKKERSFATGIFNSGSNIGAIAAPLTVPWIASHMGWQATFIIVGAIGFLWLVFWFYYYDTPKKMLEKGRIGQAEFDYIHSDEEEQAQAKTDEAKEDAGEVKWFQLLKYRQTWAFVFGKFMTDGVWWFFLFWLPAYLKVQYGITGTQIMLPLAVLYSMTMVGSIGGGWFPTYFINKGMKVYNARMTAMIVIAAFPLLVLLAQPLGHYSYWFPIIIIGIGASAHQAWSANIFTTVSDMFPKKVVASVTGIGGMAGGIGGVLISKSGGWLFDYYGAMGRIETGYTIMFTFCAVAYVVAWVVMKLLVPRFKQITDL